MDEVRSLSGSGLRRLLEAENNGMTPEELAAAWFCQRVEDMRLLTLGAPTPQWQRGEAPEAVIIAMLTGMDVQTAEVLERPESFFSRLAVRINRLAR